MRFLFATHNYFLLPLVFQFYFFLPCWGPETRPCYSQDLFRTCTALSYSSGSPPLASSGLFSLSPHPPVIYSIVNYGFTCTLFQHPIPSQCIQFPLPRTPKPCPQQLNGVDQLSYCVYFGSLLSPC